MTDPFTGQEVPRILYKYRNFEKNNSYKNHFDILSEGLVYFANPNDFNDPFDCQIPIDYHEFIRNPDAIKEFIIQHYKKNPNSFNGISLDDAIKKALIGNLNNLEFVNNFQKETVDNLNKSFGILSLSKDFDNINLWSHYSNAHTGFCFGINTEQLLKLHSINSIAPINYVADYPIISPLKEGMEALTEQLLAKSESWSNENEYRIILRNFGGKSIDISKAIEAIYLGLRISESDKKIIMEMCNNKFPKIKGYCMTKKANAFGLIPVPWLN